MTTEEEWRPVVGYEGVYSVSSLGNVRRDKQSPGAVRGRILKASEGHRGHLEVDLSNGSHSRRYLVHRLVLEAFIGPCPEGKEALHGDGTPGNNRVANLRWGTKHENRMDSVRHGTHANAKKTHCKEGHLLSGPNLRVKPTKYGLSRRCISCAREDSYARSQSCSFDSTRADARYQDLMKEEI